MPLANSIPGFEGLNTGASNIIKQLMSGQVSGAQKRAIFDAGAERGVAGGMPGSTGYAGSLFANNDLRTIGLTAGQNQQQGFQDLLAMITGYSGTIAPSAGQELQDKQFNQQLTFQKRQYNDARSRERQEAEAARQEMQGKSKNWSDFMEYQNRNVGSGGLFGVKKYTGSMDFPFSVSMGGTSIRRR